MTAAQENRDTRDHVDEILSQWAHERPDLDISPMAVVARLSRITRYFERSMEEIITPYGLNQPKFAVLAALRRSGRPFRLSPTDLYRSLLVSSGTMTRRMKSLQAAGFVERVPNEQDRRSLLVGLTRRPATFR